MQKFTHIVWDWNGTLLDDIGVCVEVINRLLARRGQKTITAEKYRQIFQFPIKEYYLSAGFDFNSEPFESVSEDYISNYMPASKVCGLVAGAREVLASIKDRDISQIILSACELNYLKAQVNERNIDGYFTEIIGLDNIHAAGKVELGIDWIAKNNIDPAKVLFIGDTDHDFETAKKMGCHCLLVAYGHQREEKLRALGVKVIGRIEDVLGELD